MALGAILPDWLEQGVESSLRDSEDDAPLVPIGVQSLQSPAPRSIASTSRASPVILTPTVPSPAGSYVRPDKTAWTDLDSFYADDGGEGEEGEEDSDEEDEDEDDEIGSNEELGESSYEEGSTDEESTEEDTEMQHAGHDT